MSQINHIKELARLGYRPGEISKKTEIDIKTIKKYLAIDDFSPVPPFKAKQILKIEKYKWVIDQWLEDDKKNWFKQRHTAKRILDRLREEYPEFDGSYSVVQRYVKSTRKTAIEKANQELVWYPGDAQVDFGEADFIDCGSKIRKKYLTVSFPYSNNGYSQVFGGETAECVCQGLKDIFEYIGSVPKLLIFDNATGVGRRIGEQIRETELFLRFRNHYGFPIRFCNPNAGYEKGNVERKVGYNRHNLFVPVPAYNDIIQYNLELLEGHKKKAAEPHYKKMEPIGKLFLEDLAAMNPLPAKPFDVCRYIWLPADGYGKVCLDSKHHYSSSPELSKREILLGVRAHAIDVYHPDGRLLTTHSRQYGDRRTDNNDHSTSLAMLMRNSGAWYNSGVREFMPHHLRTTLDQQSKQELKESLKLMHDLSQDYGFDNALAAMEEAIRRGRLNLTDTAVLAARMAGFGLETPSEIGPDLRAYDEAFLGRDDGVLS